MRILIVVPQQPVATGNWVSAERFAVGLTQAGHQVQLHGAQLDSDVELARVLTNFQPEVALLLHAYRSGKPWLEACDKESCPFAVLLTGTDVNQGLDIPEQEEIIQRVLLRADAILLQNRMLLDNLKRKCTDLAESVSYLPPGTNLGTEVFALREQLGVEKETLVFLFPASIRPVKGVLELLSMVDQLAASGARLHLAFCGPVLDEDYARDFFAALEQRSWASYLGIIPPKAMASAVREADIVLNNSASEGLSNVLLEAATLGTPILARRIPGNAAVVRHRNNGLLYDTAGEFIDFALQLINTPSLRKQLSQPNPELRDSRQEIRQLEEILGECVSHHRR